jgi:(1->4)-alpha-D-glucan 1-alpha-D-glucosylmutase
VRGVLDSKVAPAFLSDFHDMLQPIVVAGALNSLTQTLIKLAAPGVPDMYQGTELWDFSLVDPDNRRPVNFEQISNAAAPIHRSNVPELVKGWRSGALKLRLLTAGLRARALKPALFGSGAYLPLDVVGEHRQRVIAFARVRGGEAALIIAPRLVLDLLDGIDVPVVPPSRWGDTAVVLPPALAERDWSDACTGQAVHLDSRVALASVLDICPVSLMLNHANYGTSGMQ